MYFTFKRKECYKRDAYQYYIFTIKKQCTEFY